MDFYKVEKVHKMKGFMYTLGCEMEVLVSLPTWHVNLSMKGIILWYGNYGYQLGFQRIHLPMQET